MNELNQWEKALQSWTPRPPSARLKERLFPATVAVEPRRIDWVLVWNRFAPAACVILLTLFFCAGRGNGGSHLGAAGNSNELASLFLSSHNSVVSCTSMPNRGESTLSGATFDWTKAGSSLSTTGSFLFGQTNM